MKKILIVMIALVCLGFASQTHACEMPGDLDGNGIINAADFVIIKNSVINGTLEGDVDGNGVINAADYSILKTMAVDQAIFACPDEIAPVITITGDTEITITVGETYVDQGATATDDIDGSVAVQTEGLVNTNTIGDYTITYTAVDSANNTATATRTVHVIPAPAVTLTKIEITSPASKLSYTVNDALDISGLVVTGTYSDLSTKNETVTSGDISGFDSSTPVTGKILTIAVGGQTTTYTIDVVAAPETIVETPKVPVVIPGGGRSGGGAQPIRVQPTTNPTPIQNNGQVLGAQAFKFTADLSVGSTGEDVIELQNRLASEGLFTGTATGYFGPATKKAVMAFQAKHGILQTGFVGILTRSALNGSAIIGNDTLQNIEAQIALIIVQIKLIQADIAKL